MVQTTINIEKINAIVKERNKPLKSFKACKKTLHSWGTKCGNYDSVMEKKLWCSHCYQNRLDYLRGKK